jgi:chloramphenicol 3-O phosphotransferase
LEFGQNVKVAEQGWIVILNGIPRSGKTSIATELVRLRPSALCIGVDLLNRALPALAPTIGLRPYSIGPVEGYAEKQVVAEWLFLSLYRWATWLSDSGLDVIVDVGHHDDYLAPIGLTERCLALLNDRERVLKVGVRCDCEEVARRREICGMSGNLALIATWDRAVHSGWIYDVEVWTSALSAEECAREVLLLCTTRISLD